MIELRGMQKVIDGQTAVDLAELDVHPGEVVAVVGPAGSGIETLRDLLTGRVPPTAGTIRLDGIAPAADPQAFSRQAGVLFAEDALYRNLTPRANLKFFARLYGLPASRVEAVLSQVGLADQSNARIEKLAGGLQRRLAFGRAILHNPRVLLLVEPFARCDEATIGLLGALIRTLAEQGAAVLILAADQTHLLPLSDRLYLMNGGRLNSAGAETAAGRAVQPFKVPVRTEDRVLLINPAEILYADAGDGRAFLVTAEDRLPTQFTLNELEARLRRSGFFRAHRSYLVNLQHVREVIPFTRNSFSLRLDDPDGTQIPLSKSAAAELKDLLGY